MHAQFLFCFNSFHFRTQLSLNEESVFTSKLYFTITLLVCTLTYLNPVHESSPLNKAGQVYGPNPCLYNKWHCCLVLFLHLTSKKVVTFVNKHRHRKQSVLVQPTSWLHTQRDKARINLMPGHILFITHVLAVCIDVYIAGSYMYPLTVVVW